MAIGFGTFGTAPSGTTANITGTTSVTPAAPASLADGDMVLIFVWNKADSASPTTPTDWSFGATSAGGAGASANNAGATRLTVFYREKTSAWSTMPTISISGGNSAMTQAYRYTKASNQAWEIAFTTGAQATNSASYNATGAADPGITAGDMTIVGIGLGDDAPTYSAQSVTATGISAWGTMTERSEARTTQGNDLSGVVFDRPVTTGTSTAAPVVTATISVATQSGPFVLVRLREVAAATPKSASDTASISVSETASKKEGVFVGGGSSTKNVALVRNATPTADDTAIANYLTGQGHTVTEIADSALPDSGYDVVIVTESVSGGGAAMTTSDTCLLPVLMLEYTLQHTGFAGVIGAASATTTTWDLTSHSFNSGHPDPLTAAGSNQAFYVVGDADFAPGAQILAYLPSTSSVTAAIIETGGAYHSIVGGTAPARRAVLALAGGGKANAFLGQANAATYFNDIVVWTGGGSGSWIFPDSISASDTLTVGMTDASSNVELTIVNKSASDTLNVGLTDSSSVNQSIKVLPGSIAGIEPEAAGHVTGPYVDTNGNLYRLVEELLADSNHPRMMKSTDGGETWAAAGQATAPNTAGAYNDLEAAFVTPDPSTTGILWLTWYKGDSRWFATKYRTSDHATDPDTWDTTALGTTSGIEQFDSTGGRPDEVSLSTAVLSTGKVRTVLRAASGTQQILFHRTNTTGGAAWNTLTSITDGTNNILKPSMVIDNSDVCHLFYIDRTLAQVKYLTIASNDTVGSPTRVDSTNTGAVNATNRDNNLLTPVYYDAGGTPVVTVAWCNASNQLRSVEVRGGTPGSEQTVTNDTLIFNPNSTEGTTGTEGPSAALAAYGTTVYAFWGSGQYLYYATKPDGGSWSAKTELVDLGSGNSVHWLSARQFTIGGTPYIGYTYDVGPHADDGGNIKYNELTLATGPTEKTASDSASLSVAESAAVHRELAASDSATISVTESASVGNTQPGVDSTALAVTETATILATRLASDTLTVSLTEDTALSKTPVSTDTLTISLTDAQTLFKTIVSSDTSSLSVSEAAGFANQGIGAETTSLAVAETVTVVVTNTTTDSVSIGLADSSQQQGSQTRTDSAAISVTETTAFVKNISGDDGATLGVTDTGTTGGSDTRTASESTSLAVSESTTVHKSLVAADTLAVGFAEATGFTNTSPGAETNSLAVTEQTQISVTLATADSTPIAVSETSSHTLSQPVTTTDTSSLSVSETASIHKQISSTDSAILTASETAVADVALSRTDTASLGVDETRTYSISLTRTDELSIGLAEVANAAGGLAPANETVVIGLSETSSVSVSVTRADSVTIDLVEDIATGTTKTASDSVQLTITEEAAVQNNVAVLRAFFAGQWRTGNAYVWNGEEWRAITFRVYRFGNWT